MTFIHSVLWFELLSMVADATAFLDFAKTAPWHKGVTSPRLESAHAVLGKLRAGRFPAAAVRVTT